MDDQERRHLVQADRHIAEVKRHIARQQTVIARLKSGNHPTEVAELAEWMLEAFERVARRDAGGLALLRDAADAMRLSARGYHRVLRVARTLADLDGAEKVGRVHLAEALSYRALVDEVRRAA